VTFVGVVFVWLVLVLFLGSRGLGCYFGACCGR